MELSTSERSILERYQKKCLAAGGPRPGYVLRRKAIARGFTEELEEGLQELVSKGLLAASDAADLFFLTASGAEAVAEI